MIEVTHVGSLPRSADVTELIFARENEEDIDAAKFAATTAKAVEQVVGRQKDVGVTIPSDGEMSKISYATYIKDRFTGFDGDSPRRAPADLKLYPGYLDRLARTGGTASYRRPQCVGPIKVKNEQLLEND